MEEKADTEAKWNYFLLLNL